MTVRLLSLTCPAPSLSTASDALLFRQLLALPEELDEAGGLAGLSHLGVFVRLVATSPLASVWALTALGVAETGLGGA